MAPELMLTIVTALVGLLTAGILALINSWIGTRAGLDENLREQRLRHYPALWGATAGVSRWPRAELTREDLQELHRALRAWYYSDGGLFLSESARARYGDVQELIQALLERDGPPTDVLGPTAYSDLMEVASALRTALTEDLDTRRRKSAREDRRRARWHRQAAREARDRIARILESPNEFVADAGNRRRRRQWLRS